MEGHEPQSPNGKSPAVGRGERIYDTAATELVAIIKQPGAIFSATPQRSMLWADYMHRIGLIKLKPASWKDFTFPQIHDRQGS